MNKKIVIVGAGPGGLASAMLLASRGFEVEVFEKENQPGGRTSEINLNAPASAGTAAGKYRFDVGPTFFMMKFILDEIFKECGKNSEDYLEFIRLDPMYKLVLPDNQDILVYEDKKRMKEELSRVFSGEDIDLEKFYSREEKRFKSLLPILQADNQNIFNALRPGFLKAWPYFSVGRSVFDEMGRYFKPELARLVFTFQSKYLGMSPWQCPGAFGLVPYVEHAFGIYHIKGGLSEISRQMAKAAEELGVKINYNCPVKELLRDGKKVKGVVLEDREVEADEVVMNADFGYGIKELAGYPEEKLDQKKLSCSIFMWYVGLKKQYNLEHNTIVFAKDYKKNVEDVFSGKLSGEDISFYVRDHSKFDPSLAPEGKTALYVLVPVPNKRADIDWQTEKNNLRQWAIKGLKERLGLEDIEEQIEVERMHTPDEWESDYNVYKGAVFNLAHNLGQMLWFRPQNKFKEYENLYLAGGGTHPGSGLPTIFESGRITTKLICKKYKVKY